MTEPMTRDQRPTPQAAMPATPVRPPAAVAMKRDRRRWYPRTVLRPLVAFAVVVGAWWVAVRVFEIPAVILPAPGDVLAALAEHDRYLLRNAAQTAGHTLGGFAMATAAGITVAMLLATSAWARESVLPLLVAVQSVPKVSFAPMLVVWLGFGPSAKLALVALLCFFPVLVNTASGLAATPAELAELARSLTASRWQMLLKIRVPWAVPHMLTGLKVAMSLALTGAVVAEITTPNAGLGAIIVRSGQSANTAVAFAAVTLLAAIGISLYYSLVALEWRLLPWARQTTGDSIGDK